MDIPKPCLINLPNALEKEYCIISKDVNKHVLLNSKNYLICFHFLSTSIIVYLYTLMRFDKMFCGEKYLVKIKS